MFEKLSYKSWIKNYPYFNVILSLIVTLCLSVIQVDFNNKYNDILMQNFDKSTKIVSLPYEILKNFIMSYTMANLLFDTIIIVSFIALCYLLLKKENTDKNLNNLAFYITVANVFYAIALFNLFCSFDYLNTAIVGNHLHTAFDIHRLFVSDEFINYRNHTLPFLNGVI